MKKARIFSALFVFTVILSSLSPGNVLIFADDNADADDMLWEWVVYPRFASLHGFSNGLAPVSYGEPRVLPGITEPGGYLWGLIDANGNTVLPAEFEWVGYSEGRWMASRTSLRIGYESDGSIAWMPDGTAIITRSWTVGRDGSLTPYIIDQNRSDWTWELFIPNSYMRLDYPSANYRSIVDRTTGEALMTVAHDVIISPFSRGLARITGDGGWGLIDASGNIVLPTEFSYIQPFIESHLSGPDEISWMEAIGGNTVTRIIFNEDRRWGLINDRGEIVVDLIYDMTDTELYWIQRSTDFINGMAPASQNGRWGVIDTMGNIIVPIEFAYASTWSGLAAVRNDDGYVGAFDNTGRLVVPFEYDAIWGFNSDRITVMRDGRFGFVDMNGNVIVEPIFSTTHGFHGDFAAVSINGRWGFINRNGDVVVPLVYENALSFAYGVASVQMGGKWGLVRPLSSPTQHARALANTAMSEQQFMQLQIDNPLANNNAKITRIDTENDDVVPIIRNGRTLVPIRFISESFDSDVQWCDDEQKITITKDDIVIEMFIGQSRAYVNGQTVDLGAAPIIVNGRTLVPIRLVGEIMGFDVAWNEVDRVVMIQRAR